MILRFVSCIIVLAVAGSAQQGGSPPPGPSRPVEACESLLNLAMAVRSPGLQGDLLLKAVNLCSPANRQLRQNVLERVLRIANQAENLYPRDPVPIGFTDTEPALSAIASRLGIDQLSLQTRALADLAGFALRKARDWFESMQPPAPDPLSCDDFQVARLGDYYDLLRQLNDRAFSPEEAAKGVRDSFVSSHLFPVMSPAHVMGAVYFLSEAKIGAKSLETFLSMLASQLEAVDADDRSFSVHLLAEGQQNRLRALVSRCQAEGISPVAFLAAFRQYYMRHLAKPRCADAARSAPLRDREETALKQVDLLARSYLSEPGVNLTTIRSARLLETKAPRDLVVDTPQYRAWFQELADRGKPGAGREPPAAVFNRVAGEVEDWKKPAGVTERQFFQIKALVLARLMQQAASGEEWMRAAETNAEFFGKADEMQRLYPAEWLQLLKGFLSLCRGAGEMREPLMRRLESNRDIALSAYARLERTVQTAPSGGR